MFPADHGASLPSPAAAPVTNGHDIEARYRALLHGIDQGFCVIEMMFDAEQQPVDYRFLEINPVFAQHTGLANALGRTARELLPDLEQHWFDIYGRVALTGEPAHFENASRRMNRRFTVRASRLGGSGSRQVAIVFSEASQQRQSDFLADLSRRLATAASERDIMRIAVEAVGSYLDADRCYFVECLEHENLVIVSPNWQRRDSVSLEGRLSLFDFGGIDWWRRYSSGDFAVPDVRTHPLTRAKAANYEALGIRSYAVQPFRQDGAWTVVLGVTDTEPREWTRAELHLMDDVAARVWPLVQRARVDRELRASEERLRALMLASSDALYRMNADWSEMQHLDTRGFLTHTHGPNPNWLEDYIHPDERARTLAAIAEAIRTKGAFELEHRVRRADGTVGWMFSRAVPLLDAHGGIAEWFGAASDITERRQAEEALRRALEDVGRVSRTKDEFIAVLSHELRTPLTPVLMAAGSLHADERLPADVREQLGMMERNIALEARLIDDLLDLTAIARGKLQLRVQPCDAHSLISLAVEIVRADAQAKEISIACRFEAPRSGLAADPARFQQVMWNLLRNAVKFTPPRGAVAIRTSETTVDGGAGWLRIEVSDTGIGLEPGLLDQIFQPFDQGRLAGAHRFGGMGLGLAIARAVVELHGGRISAHSAGPDRGALFVVDLPGAIEAPAGLAAGAAPAPPATPPAAPLRLLLVEDHESTLRTLTLLLRRDGHEVVPVGTMIAALAAAATHRFDLVLSDLGLPDGTGIELMARLRDDHGLRGVALSGYGMEGDLARSRAAGFVAHLVKPIAIAELRRVVGELGQTGTPTAGSGKPIDNQ